MREPLGLIGLGLVGTALAERLLAAGFEVVGYDLVREKCERLASLGGRVAADGRDVAARACRVVLPLLTSQQVRTVIEADVLQADPPPSLIVDTTTGSPDDAEAAAEALAPHGIGYVDATLVGSSAQIARGEGVFLVGGSEGDVAACADILGAVGREAHHVGPVGAGARAKLMVNLVLGLNRAALAEGLAFAEALGLSPASVLPLLQGTMAYSRIMDTKGRKMVEGDLTPEARLAQHRKDVALILEQAGKHGQALPLSEEHLRLLDAAIAAGDGDLDNAALVRELTRRRRPFPPSEGRGEGG